MNRDQVVFAYAGKLWTVPRAGGPAHQLTQGALQANHPDFLTYWEHYRGVKGSQIWVTDLKTLERTHRLSTDQSTPTPSGTQSAFRWVVPSENLEDCGAELFEGSLVGDLEVAMPAVEEIARL